MGEGTISLDLLMAISLLEAVAATWKVHPTVEDPSHDIISVWLL
jgi:hypothetical protein